MSKKITVKEKQIMDIRDLHAIVHNAQNKGVTVKETLGKYKVSKRAYYTACKNNNLPPWRANNKTSVLVQNKGALPKRGLVGGSLAAPKKSATDHRVAFAKDLESIEAKKKKSREINIPRR